MTATDAIQLDESWKNELSEEFSSPYMQSLKQFLQAQRANGKTIFPKTNEYFHALNTTPLHEVRAVILGQDPYHGDGQAHGLCFSVKPGVRTPPSLINIYKELHGDLGLAVPNHGYLDHWAKQGVLLLNSVLTVERGQAGSHQGKGWENFTDAVIREVNALDRPVVFFLWGAYAQKKAAFVDRQKHLVLEAPHPSPLSAHRGFLGCGHFSKANEFLKEKGIEPIDWSLPEKVE